MDLAFDDIQCILHNYTPLVISGNDKKAANIIKPKQTGINRNKDVPSIRVTSSVINNFVRAKRTLLGLFV